MEDVINIAATPPFVAPISQDREHRPPPSKSRRSARLLLLSLLAFGTTIGLLMLHLAAERDIAAVGFGLTSLLALVGSGYALVALLAHLANVRPAPVGLLFLGLFGNGLMAFIGASSTFLSVVGFARGRQIRRFGRVLLPPVQDSADWALELDRLPVDDTLRDALAQQWRENGRTEHASVAAFSRLSLDLLALGAPPALVAAAQRDALDEIRHAELCFSLARSIDGKVVSPGPFVEVRGAKPFSGPRKIVLARLAVDSLIDGALHEGVSARVLSQLARRSELGAIRSLLKELAADEGRHAAHGWEVVAWCVSEGGVPVLNALRGAMRALPTTLVSALPLAATAGAWERYGIHGHALEAEEYHKARQDMMRRVDAMCGDRAAA